MGRRRAAHDRNIDRALSGTIDHLDRSDAGNGRQGDSSADRRSGIAALCAAQRLALWGGFDLPGYEYLVGI